jgi:pheromone shutdown protein TraB
VLPNIVMASLFAALAGAKPLSVLVAGVASPITSLNPTIGAGMFSGLVEAWLRKPTVEDCEGVGDAVASVKGMYRNRFTRVLLVFVATNIGSSLGAWVGGIWVVKLL